MADTNQEQVLHYSSYPAWRTFWAPMLLGFVFLFYYGVGLVAVPVILFARYRNHYSIRGNGGDAEIEARRGLIAKHTSSIRIRDVRNMNVHQSIMQRLMGTGTVEFSSAGGSGIEVAFRDVPRPQQVKALAQTLQQGK